MSVETGDVADAVHELGERSLTGGVVADPAAEHGLHLDLRGVPDPLLERLRHQRREPVGGERHAEENDADEETRGGNRPADDLRHAAAAGLVLIEPRAAGNDLGRKRV